LPGKVCHNELIIITGGAHLFMSVKRKMVCSMVESGGYLDFGSWASECITDPDLCVDGLTVTMWLRIQAKDINYNSEYQYIISSGAEGESMRGIVFLLKVRIDNCHYRTDFKTRHGGANKSPQLERAHC
jgi:hypothetical protein